MQENQALKIVANSLSRKEEKICLVTKLSYSKNHTQVNAFYKLGPTVLT